MWFIIRNYLIDNYAFGIEGYEVVERYNDEEEAISESHKLNFSKEHGEHYFVNFFVDWEEAENWCKQ